MEQIVLSSSGLSSTLKFEPAMSAAPFAQFNLPNCVRAFAVVVACGTAFAVPPARPTSETGLRPYHAPIGAFAPAEETVAKQLAELRSLVDGEGVVVVSDHLIAHVQRLLERIPPDIDQPRTAPSVDGEIGMSWAAGDNRLEAVLDPDDRLVWITKINGKYAPGGDVSILSDQGLLSFYSALDGFYGRV
jgi:hypothetical protein